MPVPWIPAHAPADCFPDPRDALDAPNGLLAAGGTLDPERLVAAYRRGIFPWYSDGQPLLWWSPDPRMLLYPGALRLSRSLARRLRSGSFQVSLDRDFPAVVSGCAAPRRGEPGTWITAEMGHAYIGLHRRGLAHSVEVWEDGRLAGGLYGVSLGAAFFGESMFSVATDASKVALAWLAGQLRRWGFRFIDCQLPTPHLERLGAVPVHRDAFLAELAAAGRCATRAGSWSFDPDLTVENLIAELRHGRP